MSHALKTARALRNQYVNAGLPPEFLPKCPRNVPGLEAFHRIVERLRTGGTVHPLAHRGTKPTSDVGVVRVRNLFDDHPDSYIHSAAQ